MKHIWCLSVWKADREKWGKGDKSRIWNCSRRHLIIAAFLPFATKLQIMTDVQGLFLFIFFIALCRWDVTLWPNLNNAIRLVLLTYTEPVIFPLLIPLCLKSQGINGVQKSTGIWIHFFFCYVLNNLHIFYVPQHLLWLLISTRPNFHLRQKLGLYVFCVGLDSADHQSST